MTTLNTRTTNTRPAFSIPSIIAIICAVATFIVDGAGTRMLLAVLAAVFGVIGCIIALLPGKRGGIISFVSLAIGAIAFIVAIVQALNGLAD